mgnify:CR=1 FL=1
MQDGRGTFTWANGAVYEGEWKNNKREGKGTYKWSNGDVYEGDLTEKPNISILEITEKRSRSAENNRPRNLTKV